MSARAAALCLRGLIIGAFVLPLAGGALAEGRQLTAQDYAQAEKFMPYETEPLVDHDVVRVHWMPNDRFWYLDHDAEGDHYRIMDARSGRISAAFDQDKLAGALTEAAGTKITPSKLDISEIGSVRGQLEITHDGKQYLCDLSGVGHCSDEAKLAKGGKEPGVLSPDGKLLAFIRNWNLWVRDVASGGETQLTFDGVANFGYATDDGAWERSDSPVVDWSPDSTQIATFQQDQRKVGDMYLVSAEIGHPHLQQWKYPLPGDKDVFMIEPVVIDVATRKVVRLQLPPQQRLSSLCDDIYCGDDDGHWDDLQWAADGRTLALVTTSRDRQHEWFHIADARTGAVRTVFQESVAKYFGSGIATYYESGGISAVDWRYLPRSNEAIWYSDRTDWGNLYLYSLKSGTLEHPITTGTGDVTQVLHLDRKSRTVWFRAVERVRGMNPNYEQLWRTSLDGGKPKLLTAENCDHIISMDPDGKYFVDDCSTPTQPPVTTLRNAKTGRILATVAKADVSRLRAIGWQPPEPIVVKARDGKTDLYGLLFKPANFDPQRKYPIVDYVYPGPLIGSILTFSFLPSDYDDQALANLGFIVVSVNGMGTAFRSASFEKYWYGNMGDNTLPDQVAAMKQLAQRYPWIDIDRAGIWGHSGGGDATADAMFRYPDFFKVGWSESGDHDTRDYENDWGEKYQGLLERNSNGTTNYDNQGNELVASQLKGHLMLTYGTVDDNVPPENTEIVVAALIKANKNFDMIAIPNERHSYGKSTPYITRRRWDYFVHWLGGDTPPAQYALKPWPWN